VNAENWHVNVVISLRELKIVITGVHFLDIGLKYKLKLLEHFVTELNFAFLDHDDSLKHLIEKVPKLIFLLSLLMDQLENLIAIQFHLSVNKHEKEATKD
jgi:hypothetical protein